MLACRNTFPLAVFLRAETAELAQRISTKKKLASPVAVQDRVRKKGLKVTYSDICETHGTLLTKYLKDNEVDFLHGRATSNVFMRNYFNPSLISDLKTRVLKATSEMQERISLSQNALLFLKSSA
jgi:hypothetical protein